MNDPALQAQIQSVLGFLRAGFDQINAVEGLFIAAVAALLMPSWPRLLLFAAGATLANVVVDLLIPVLVQHQPFRLPPLLDANFWWPGVAVLFVGYFLVIAVFYAVKRLILRTVQ